MSSLVSLLVLHQSRALVLLAPLLLLASTTTAGEPGQLSKEPTEQKASKPPSEGPRGGKEDTGDKKEPKDVAEPYDADRPFKDVYSDGFPELPDTHGPSERGGGASIDSGTGEWSFAMPFGDEASGHDLNIHSDGHMSFSLPGLELRPDCDELLTDNDLSVRYGKEFGPSFTGYSKEQTRDSPAETGGTIGITIDWDSLFERDRRR